MKKFKIYILVLILSMVLTTGCKINFNINKDSQAKSEESEELVESEELEYNSKSQELIINEDEILSYDDVKDHLLKKENITAGEVLAKIGDKDKESDDLFYVYKIPLKVSDEYSPEVEFTLKLNKDEDFYTVSDILFVDMDTNSNGITKEFGGNVWYIIEDDTLVHYRVSGDFFSGGVSSVDFSLIKDADPVQGNATFSVKDPGKQYKYVHEELAFYIED